MSYGDRSRTVVCVLSTTRPHRCAPAPFFFDDAATTEIYSLSLHDALPILRPMIPRSCSICMAAATSSDRSSPTAAWSPASERDRKSTRLNSSHTVISYAVFCLKKKISNCPLRLSHTLSHLEPHDCIDRTET